MCLATRSNLQLPDQGREFAQRHHVGLHWRLSGSELGLDEDPGDADQTAARASTGTELRYPPEEAPLPLASTDGGVEDHRRC